MFNKETTSKNESDIRTLISACITLVIGVLFACSMSFGIRGLSWLIGISLCISGVLLIVGTVMKNKAVVNADGIIGAAIACFGVMFIMRSMASIIVDYIPMLMIAVGITTVVDAFLGKFWRKEEGIARFILFLTVGALATALGFCIKFINGWADKAAIVLGAIMIVYSIFELLTLFINKQRAGE